MTVLSPGQKHAVAQVKSRRIELGLSQEQVAEAAGVHVNTVRLLESGQRWGHARTRERVERLALGWPAGRMDEIAEAYAEGTPVDSLVRTLRELGVPEESLADRVVDGLSHMPFTDASRAVLAASTLDEGTKQGIITRLPLGARAGDDELIAEADAIAGSTDNGDGELRASAG